MADSAILGWLIDLVLGMVLILAQLKLFSIDKTLKMILSELQKGKSAVTQKKEVSPEVIERLRQKGLLPKEGQ